MRTNALSWGTGLFCALLGALMLVAPHQFETASYPALRTNTAAWGAAFFVAGAGLVVATALAAARPLALATHFLATAVLLLLAQGFGATGSVTGAIVYVILGLATAAAPLLPRDPRRATSAPDLLALTIGVTAVLVGLALLLLPERLRPPALAPVAPYLGGLGVLFLGGGLGLLVVHLRRIGRAALWAAHLVAGAAYGVFAVTVTLPSRGTTGLVYYGGFGVAVAVLPWLAPRLARVDPASLRTRLALALIAATALPLLVAVAVGNDQAERARVAEALAEQGVVAAALSRDVVTHGSTFRAAMATVASRLDPTWELERQRAALASLTLTDVFAFATFDADGRPVARSDDHPPTPLARRLEDEMRRTGAAAQDVAVSPSGRPVITFAAPSRGPGGDLRGFVSAEMDATRLAAALARSRPTGGPEGQTVFVVDGGGHMISHSNPGAVPAGADRSTHPAVAALLATREGGTLRHASSDGEQLSGYAPVAGLGWGVVAMRPVATVVAATRALRDLSFWFLLAVTAAAAAAGVVAADRLARPLRALTGAVDSLAAGDANTPLPRSEIGEVAGLSARFGEMRDRLAEQTAALRGSEARKDAILRTALDGIVTLDEAGRVVDLNPAAEELLGYDRDEAIGRELVELALPPDAREELRGAWGQLTAAGEDLEGAVPIELTLARRDGSVFPAEVAISPIDLGLTRLVTAFVRDISDRKQAEAERARRLAHEEVVRAKDELVSIVSHELRTPLVSLVGFTELMLTREFSEADRREFLTIILEDGRRLTALINDFLDLERMESGRLQIVPQPTDIAPLLRRAVASAGEDAERPIVLDLPDDLPTVAADDDRVLQVMANLLSNARKYSPAGGEVRVSARALEGAVEVSLADRGLGIPDDALPQLFEKFYRVDNSDRREIGGTGLGLAICRQIVGAHGGRIWAESDGLGNGATFRFTLPTADASPTTGDVLVVEDEAGFARLLETELADLGLTTVRATSAEEALARLEESPPRAVVLDLLLPGIQGEALLARLKGDGHPPIPVVVVTVKDLGVAERAEFERLGVFAVFRKGPGVASQAARAVGGLLRDAASPSRRPTGSEESG